MSAIVISLGERAARKAAPVHSANVPELGGMDGALWEALLRIGSHLMVASCEIKKGKTDPAQASAYLWRVAQSLEEMASRADRLERKYRKAKKRAKSRDD
jgi:hypothetical protein